MNILLLEPFFGGSHESWALGLQNHSNHKIEILSLSPHNWKWRMHGGAVSLSQKYLDSKFCPDLIVASDMLDLATFKSLSYSKMKNCKTAVYFHENQLTYPSENHGTVEKDMHYPFINFTSALVADKLFFNSEFHKNDFFDALPKYLNAFPEPSLTNRISEIEKKSSVLYPGIEISQQVKQSTCKEELPLILWNHRWEKDKNPEDFFRLLYALKNNGLKFSLALLGQEFKNSPTCFAEAKMRLRDNIIHSGFCNSKEEYFSFLHKSDILPVTSFHDFFGYSVVEAIFLNSYPLLPNRQAYPEHIPAKFKSDFLYNSNDELLEKMIYCINNIAKIRQTSVKSFVTKYLWENIIAEYDAAFETILS